MITGQSPLLTVQDLTVAFNGSPVVRGISFHIDHGETLGLVGSSGSGKSVTALAIMRLLDFERNATVVAGSIVFKKRDGVAVDLMRISPDEMRRIRGREIAMVFQEPLTALNPVIPVGKQIAETVRAHTRCNRKEALAAAQEMLDRVRIHDSHRRIRQYPHELSGGMRQRVMIAIALACHPQLLIADEPTTALDVTIQRDILTLLEQLQREEGISVLFITHDMGVIAEISDRTVVMNKGSVVEVAPTIDLFRSPQTVYAKMLIDAVPKLAGSEE